MKIFFIVKEKDAIEELVVANCLREQGHDVNTMDEVGYTNKDYLVKIEEFKPDVVLFFKLRTMQPATALIKSLKILKIPTASWTFDLLIGHPARQDNVPHLPFLRADYVFMTDGGRDEEYKKLNVNKITLRQGIAKENCFIQPKTEGEPMRDIVFVGTENVTFPYRGRLLKFLEETYGDRFHWIGRHNSMEMRGHALNDLYSHSKIVIGDSMYGDNYWSNRVYETLGRGGFLIHPRVEGMDKEFTWYKHLVPYEWADFEGLKEKIDYFLVHDEERDKIRKAGFKHVKDNYLYDIRIKELVRILEEKI